MNRNHDAMTEFCTVHGVVPARNSFRYCPYEVVAAVFDKMLKMGKPIEVVRTAIGSQLWFSMSDYDVWRSKMLCAHPDCTTRPIYNVKGSNTPLFCREHKSDDMVDVKNKMCAHPDCTTQPSYNVKGSKTPLFCREHKSDDMVDVIHSHL